MRVAVVVPFFDEEATLDAFHARLSAVAGSLPRHAFEFVFVDDGSTDRTWEGLSRLAAADPRIRALRFARNRGHQVALTAGLDHADADAVVVIDSDLQDPPEVIPELLARVEEGCDVVHARRRRRAGEGWFKRASASVYYALLRRLAPREVVADAGDFRAISRRALAVVRSFREPHRFLRGIFAGLGFRQCVVEYDRDARHAGETKYTLRRMLRLAANGIVSHSSAPLALVTAVGWVLLGVPVVLFGLWATGVVDRGPTATFAALLSLATGIVLLAIGVVGAYVGRIFEQGQRRPLYWIQDARNLDGRPPGLPESSEAHLGRVTLGLESPAPSRGSVPPT